MKRRRQIQPSDSIRAAARSVDRGTGASPRERTAVTERAAQGVSGAGTDFPFLEQLSALLGHDLQNLSAHIGGGSAEACRDLDARGYAMGTQVAFGKQPSLWTAAHEAAHCLTQQAGVGVSGGIGRQGDSGEQLANRVADLAASGHSAASLLPSRGQVQGSGGTTAVQFFKETRGDDGRDYRISDDGHMKVRTATREYDDGSVALLGTKDFFVDGSQTDDWNAKLNEVDSAIDLSTEEGPGYSRVHSSNNRNGTEGDRLRIWADCLRSAREVLGVRDELMEPLRGVYFKEREATQGEMKNRLDRTGVFDLDWKIREEKLTKFGNPDLILYGVIHDLVGGESMVDSMLTYLSLPAEERDAFDEQAEINRYAQPEAGEGFTMISAGSPVPVETLRDQRHDGDSDGFVDAWNFHYAGVVGRSGGDFVTLENYAEGDFDTENNRWQHQMYGLENGDTFYDAHKQSKQHGSDPFAFRVRKTGLLD